MNKKQKIDWGILVSMLKESKAEGCMRGGIIDIAKRIILDHPDDLEKGVAIKILLDYVHSENYSDIIRFANENKEKIGDKVHKIILNFCNLTKKR